MKHVLEGLDGFWNGEDECWEASPWEATAFRDPLPEQPAEYAELDVRWVPLDDLTAALYPPDGMAGGDGLIVESPPLTEDGVVAEQAVLVGDLAVVLRVAQRDGVLIVSSDVFRDRQWQGSAIHHELPLGAHPLMS